MILPDCRIIWNENQRSDYSGLDSRQNCLIKKHFDSYPYSIEYRYNSRGFRGDEWPNDLGESIWCIGDSFTVGLGAPESHTWWRVLQQATQRVCINVSLDGASNAWISRWAQQIIKEVRPALMVVHWSYTHRRERPLQEVQDQIWREYYAAIRDSTWPDCASYHDISTLPISVQRDLAQDPKINCYTQGFDLESLRRVHQTQSTVEQDAQHTAWVIETLEQNRQQTKVIHSHINRWHPVELKFQTGQWIREFDQIDLARDGLHYDILTANQLVSRILEIL